VPRRGRRRARIAVAASTAAARPSSPPRAGLEAAAAAPAPLRKTRIVCTIGPAVGSREALFALFDAGCDVARLNMSHGTHASHGAIMALVREYNALGRRPPVATLLDTKGPEVRSGDVVQPIQMARGDKLTFTTREGADGARPASFISAFLRSSGAAAASCRSRRGRRRQITARCLHALKLPSIHGCETAGTNGVISVNYDEFPNDVAAGDELLVDGGLLVFAVTGKSGPDVYVEVVDGGARAARVSEAASMRDGIMLGAVGGLCADPPAARRCRLPPAAQNMRKYKAGEMASRRHLNVRGKSANLPAITSKDWQARARPPRRSAARRCRAAPAAGACACTAHRRRHFPPFPNRTLSLASTRASSSSPSHL
jgi:hypothetical protein